MGDGRGVVVGFGVVGGVVVGFWMMVWVVRLGSVRGRGVGLWMRVGCGEEGGGGRGMFGRGGGWGAVVWREGGKGLVETGSRCWGLDGGFGGEEDEEGGFGDGVLKIGNY